MALQMCVFLRRIACVLARVCQGISFALLILNSLFLPCRIPKILTKFAFSYNLDIYSFVLVLNETQQRKISTVFTFTMFCCFSI